MYSPDGFSPPPMEDMSPTSGFPPPMDFPPDCSSPEEDEEDLEGDTDYDLTGLSDKLHSLELRKISNLPPREILELQKASDELSSRFADSLQVMRIPGKVEGKEVNREMPPLPNSMSDIQSNSPEAHFPPEEPPGLDLNKNRAEIIDRLVDSETLAPSLSQNEGELQENVSLGISDQDMLDCEVPETNLNGISEGCEELDESTLCKGEGSQKVETEAVIDDEERGDFFSGSCDQTEGPSRVQESWNAFPPSTSDDDEDWGEVVKVGEGDQWGDFGEQARAIQAAGDVDVEEEEEDEDEFGDFGEAEEVAPAPVIHVTGLADSLLELKDWSELEEILGVEKSRLGESDLKTQVGLGPDLSSQVEEDETVWRRLEDPASSPGLDYVWRDSGTYNIVLSTLGIDSRIVLDGPGWLGQVRQAATLLTPGLLTPVPAARQEKEGSPETQLDAYPSGEPPSSRKVEMEESKGGTEVVRKNSNPGKEAAEILRAFPLLDFMASSLLVRSKK